MPRGQHPNSKKALEEHRKGTQFKKGERTVESIDNQKATMARRRTFREEFEAELAAIIRDNNGKETTVKNAITKTAVQKAIKGDLRALELIRDTIGEKPAENIVLFEADSSVITEIEMMVYDTP
jgi:hypothetical protein